MTFLLLFLRWTNFLTLWLITNSYTPNCPVNKLIWFCSRNFHKLLNLNFDCPQTGNCTFFVNRNQRFIQLHWKCVYKEKVWTIFTPNILQDLEQQQNFPIKLHLNFEFIFMIFNQKLVWKFYAGQRILISGNLLKQILNVSVCLLLPREKFHFRKNYEDPNVRIIICFLFIFIQFQEATAMISDWPLNRIIDVK